MEKQIVCKPANMKAPQMNSWSDDRLNELSTRTDEGFKDVKAEFRGVKAEFKEVKAEFKEVRQEMKDGFNRVDERFHRLWGTLVFASFGIIGAIIGTGILT